MPTPTSAQIRSVERLVHESVQRVDAIAPEALRAVLPALRQARDELRADLYRWLANAPDGHERFTAYQRAQALRSLEATFERIGELQPAMAGALGLGRHETGALGVKNLEHEVQRLSSMFGGGHVVLPQIDTAAVIAQGNKLLWKRHERSAARYAGGIGDDVRTRMAVSLAKGDTFEQTVQRLRGSADFRHAVAASDRGAAASGVADAMFNRWRHWADRLVRTENMHAYNTQHDLAIEHVNENRSEDDDEYLRRWDATADKVACERCKALDRTVATIKGTFAGGIKSPPLHPYCRCVVLAWLARWGNIKGEVPALHHGGDEEIQRPHQSEKERTRKIAENKAAAAEDLAAYDKHKEAAAQMQAAKERQAKQLAEHKAKQAKPAPKPAARAPEQSEAAQAMATTRDAAGKAHGLAEKQAQATKVIAAGRQQLDREFSAAGMSARETVAGGSARTTVLPKLWLDASGMHNFETGAITISKAQADGAEAFAQAHAKNPRAARAAQAAYEKAKDEGRAPTTAQEKRGAALHDAGQKYSTIVHETLHGYGATTVEDYKGNAHNGEAGSKVEEITTEIASRAHMRRNFGINLNRSSDSPIDPLDITYEHEIQESLVGIRRAAHTTLDHKQSLEILEHASEEYKRAAPDGTRHPHERMAELIAKRLPVPDDKDSALWHEQHSSATFRDGSPMTNHQKRVERILAKELGHAEEKQTARSVEPETKRHPGGAGVHPGEGEKQRHTERGKGAATAAGRSDGANPSAVVKQAAADAKLEADKAEAAARAVLEKKNPKRVAAAKKAAEASAERRREIHSAAKTNLPQELQAAWDKEGHKFMQQESKRVKGVKDRINAASKFSEAFAEQYGSGDAAHEGDKSHKRAEIDAKHAESWADEQERKYYERARAEMPSSKQARRDEHDTWAGDPPKVIDDDDPPF